MGKNSYYFAPFKYLNLEDLKLSVSVEEKDQLFELTVKSEKSSLFVELRV